MPRFIIKPERDVDFYVDWSTIVDAPCEWGPAAAFTEPIPADRLARADETGTSCRDPRFFGWDDKTLIVANMGDGDFYQIPRENLRAWLEALGETPDDQAAQQAALDQYATRCGDDQ